MYQLLKRRNYAKLLTLNLKRFFAQTIKCGIVTFANTRRNLLLIHRVKVTVGYELKKSYL